jgi:hypothetical protein
VHRFESSGLARSRSTFRTFLTLRAQVLSNQTSIIGQPVPYEEGAAGSTVQNGTADSKPPVMQPQQHSQFVGPTVTAGSSMASSAASGLVYPISQLNPYQNKCVLRVC